MILFACDLMKLMIDEKQLKFQNLEKLKNIQNSSKSYSILNPIGFLKCHEFILSIVIFRMGEKSFEAKFVMKTRGFVNVNKGNNGSKLKYNVVY